MTQRIAITISLPPELARFVQERVATGLYSSASEVVREALRRTAAAALDREHPVDQVHEGAAPSPDPVGDLQVADWRELRAALLRGERELGLERSREQESLFHAALQMTRDRLRREMPEAEESVIEKHLAQWLHERAGAEVGDHPGRPASPERWRRITGE